jgi:hypothetical protein
LLGDQFVMAKDFFGPLTFVSAGGALYGMDDQRALDSCGTVGAEKTKTVMLHCYIESKPPRTYRPNRPNRPRYCR